MVLRDRLLDQIGKERGGRSEIGRELSGVVIGNRAIASLYMPKIQAILYGPEYIPIPLMQRTVTSPGFMPKPAKKPAAKKPKS